MLVVLDAKPATIAEWVSFATRTAAVPSAAARARVPMDGVVTNKPDGAPILLSRSRMLALCWETPLRQRMWGRRSPLEYAVN